MTKTQLSFKNSDFVVKRITENKSWLTKNEQTNEHYYQDERPHKVNLVVWLFLCLGWQEVSRSIANQPHTNFL